MQTLTPEALSRIDTPAVLVDWPQVQANVSEMAAAYSQHGFQMMPHIKTHKSVEIAKLQLEAGALGLTCAKLSEAKAMLPSGVKRIFLAHSLVSKTKIPMLQEVAVALDELIVAVTSPEQAKHLDALLSDAGLKLSCLLALNSGLNREGARSLDELRAMKAVVDASATLDYRGIYSHEGHTYVSAADEVQAKTSQAASLLREARNAMGGEGELWPGCSVTARYMALEEGMTGGRPGAYVFGDLSLTSFTGAMPWAHLALSVAVTVVDKPESGLALIDAGSKVFSSDKFGDHPYARPLDQRDFGLTRLSEEHGFLTGSQVDELQIGEVIQLVPVHVCPVVNLTTQLEIVCEESISGSLTVDARGCVK